VVGLAGAVVAGAAAVVGLVAPPDWQALKKSASADAPAASKRILRIGYISFRGSSGEPCRGARISRAPVHLNRSRRELQAKKPIGPSTRRAQRGRPWMSILVASVARR